MKATERGDLDPTRFAVLTNEEMKVTGPTRWGPMTIERHTALKQSGIHVRVFVRGEDVTDRCQYADDTPGHEVAELLRTTPSGMFYKDEDWHPAVEVAHDQIEFRVKQNA